MHVSRRFQNTAVFVASGAPQDSIGRQAVIELERQTGNVLRVHNARIEKRSPYLQSLEGNWPSLLGSWQAGPPHPP